MFRQQIAAVVSSARGRRGAVLLLLGLSVFQPVQTVGQAEVEDALPYSTSYLVTGDYVAGGVDLQSANEVNGFVTGTIDMSGVPANADILAAFLYWESIYENESQLGGVQFRGAPVPAIRKSPMVLTPDTPCFTTGPNLQMAMFRADVLPFLPVQKDAAGNKTGKRIVNAADLLANGLEPHIVKLPQGNGNLAPESAGASLVVVYRDPDPNAALRKVVVYDGIYVQPMAGTMTQRLRGFYKSAATPSAKMTHIVGSGAKNQTETLGFNGEPLSTNAFPEADASSDRGWFTRTDAVSLSLNNQADGQYGESATTTVTHTNNNPYECLAWGGIVFSTAVKDTDNDGLPDGLEDAPGGLLNPNGEPLPNLNAMGARSSENGLPHKDIFIEVNAMRTDGETYGPTEDADGHNHLPTPEVLRMVGAVYADRGITPHFDVGDIAAYHALGGDYASTEADGYLVGPGARGGESILEKACVPSATVKCQFPDYPGTVGWKFGFQEYRDAPVGTNGEELTPAVEDVCRVNPTNAACSGRRRFDRIRSSLFHYALYAHARAKPKSPFPCLTALGQVAEYVNGACAVAVNPEFHVPKSISGVADLPGGNLMITLGMWDNFVGTPFVQASTTLHELGHNLNLGHGGALADANCKPNYLSSMSYLFQVHGLYKDDQEGSPHLDYSGSAHGSIDENFPGDGQMGPLTPAYRPAWFVPFNSPLAVTLGASAATKFCNGSKFNPASLPSGMARVEATSAAASIDWNGNGETDTAAAQNVNFDGTFFDGFTGGIPILSSALSGYDDWSNLRLNQIGAGRAVARFLTFDGSSFEGSSFEGSSFEGSSFEGSSFEGSSFEGSSFEGSSFEGSSFEGSSFEGSSFEGSSFEGSSFEGSSFEGSSFEGQELDYESAKALGRTQPHALKACVLGVDCTSGSVPLHRTRLQWKAPNLGAVTEYRLRRVKGATVAAGSTSALAGTTSTTSVDDSTELPHGVQFTYFVRALFDDGGQSGASNFRTITAVNDPPVAVADGSYVATPGTTLSVAAPGVLANDTDGDSPATSLKAVLVAPPGNGEFKLNADGSFEYTPTGCGPVSFDYKANNGIWNNDPTVPMNAVDSNTVTVTITMTCAPANNPPVANPDSGSVVIGGSTTINVLANDTDADGHSVTITGVSPAAQGTVTFTSANVTYTASTSFVGGDSFTYTISDGHGSTATGTVTMTAGHGFVGVQNLPPPAGKTFNRGGAVPLLWRYTNSAGVAIDSTNANPQVIATPVAVVAPLPPGWTGAFTVADPGSSSFQLPTAKNGYTWQFNWKLVYRDPATGNVLNLPAGTYRVIIKSGATGQQDPVINGTVGVLITVK